MLSLSFRNKVTKTKWVFFHFENCDRNEIGHFKKFRNILLNTFKLQNNWTCLLWRLVIVRLLLAQQEWPKNETLSTLPGLTILGQYETNCYRQYLDEGSRSESTMTQSTVLAMKEALIKHRLTSTF